ncbi:MAG: hypothetical protein WAQ57_00265 [Candidatus Saccharimonadales bacterium]
MDGIVGQKAASFDQKTQKHTSHGHYYGAEVFAGMQLRIALFEQGAIHG